MAEALNSGSKELPAAWIDVTVPLRFQVQDSQLIFHKASFFSGGQKWILDGDITNVWISKSCNLLGIQEEEETLQQRFVCSLQGSAVAQEYQIYLSNAVKVACL